MITSIKWYHVSHDNPIDDRQQEIATREEEQIIGSYLYIPRITMTHYGRYLCRVEIANSKNHCLEMSAGLFNARPIETNATKIFLNPYYLATCSEFAAILMLLIVLCSQRWWRQHNWNSSNKMILRFSPQKIENFLRHEKHGMDLDHTIT